MNKSTIICLSVIFLLTGIILGLSVMRLLKTTEQTCKDGTYIKVSGTCVKICPDGKTFTNDWRKCPKTLCTPPNVGCPAGLVCDTDFTCIGQCGPALECGDGLCTWWCETIDNCPQDCTFLK